MRVTSDDGRKRNSTAIATATRILRKWRRWAAELLAHGWLVLEPGTWRQVSATLVEVDEGVLEGMDGAPVDMYTDDIPRKETP